MNTLPRGDCQEEGCQEVDTLSRKLSLLAAAVDCVELVAVVRDTCPKASVGLVPSRLGEGAPVAFEQGTEDPKNEHPCASHQAGMKSHRLDS